MDRPIYKRYGDPKSNDKEFIKLMLKYFWDIFIFHKTHQKLCLRSMRTTQLTILSPFLAAWWQFSSFLRVVTEDKLWDAQLEWNFMNDYKKRTVINFILGIKFSFMVRSHISLNAPFKKFDTGLTKKFSSSSQLTESPLLDPSWLYIFFGDLITSAGEYRF